MTCQRRSNRLTAALATGICASALAAPAALASPDIGPVIRDADGPAPEPAPLIVRVPDGGFDWGSAAIGAGTAGALVVLVSLGGVAIASRHRAALP